VVLLRTRGRIVYFFERIGDPMSFGEIVDNALKENPDLHTEEAVDLYFQRRRDVHAFQEACEEDSALEHWDGV